MKKGILDKIFIKEHNEIEIMWPINAEYNLFRYKGIYIAVRIIDNGDKIGNILLLDRDKDNLVGFIQESAKVILPNMRLYISPNTCTSFEKIANLITNYYGFGISETKEYMYYEDTLKELK